MRTYLGLILFGVLLATGWGCGKGEYDRRMGASISGSGVTSGEDEDTAASPAEAFAILSEKGCLFFDPSVGIRDMSPDAAKSAQKVTEFGEEANYDVLIDGSAMSDADTASLPSLGSQINGITIVGAIGDGAMENVVRLRGLTWINLFNTNITDNGLGDLGDLSNVRSLRMMDNASISDNAIVPVLELENLRKVYVKGPFTNIGLEELGFHEKIDEIEITLGGEVTQEIIDYLKQEMIDVSITAK